MNKFKILYELIWYVNDKKKFTAQDIANHFQLSTRTVYRYLNEIAEMGIYLISEQGKGGGYQVLDNPVLPPILFTEDEIVSIFTAYKSITSYHDFPFQVDMETTAQKLKMALPKKSQVKIWDLGESFQMLTSQQVVETPFLNEVMKACIQKQFISFTYMSLKKKSNKHVACIGLYGSNGFWYLYGYDTKIQEMRHYRIDRMVTLIVEDEQHDRKEELNDIHKVYQPEDAMNVRLKLDAIGIQRCLENRFIAKDVIVESAEIGYLNTKIAKADLGFIHDAIISLREHAIVLEPQMLIDEIKEHAQMLLKIYR